MRHTINPLYFDSEDVHRAVNPLYQTYSDGEGKYVAIGQDGHYILPVGNDRNDGNYLLTVPHDYDTAGRGQYDLATDSGAQQYDIATTRGGLYDTVKVLAKDGNNIYLYDIAVEEQLDATYTFATGDNGYFQVDPNSGLTYTLINPCLSTSSSKTTTISSNSIADTDSYSSVVTEELNEEFHKS